MGIKSFDVMSLGKAGIFDPKEMGYRDSLDIIKEESVKIQKSFVKIGWYLKHIQDKELYLEDGYANINECAADQLGYSQSTVSRLIGICEKFSKDHDSPELDERYSGFDKSQMIEMLPMDQGQLEKVTPEMTVRQIRDIKSEGNERKKRTGNNGEKNVESPVGRDETEDDLPGQTSIEEDFPEYMPDTVSPDSVFPDPQEENYATSHKEEETEENRQPEKSAVVDGTYQEMVKFPWKTTQPELPILKNNDQRKEWLSKYKDWGLWYRDDNIDVNYYKFDFDDGSRLVVVEYPQRYQYWNGKRENEFDYHLLEKNKQGYGSTTYDESFRHQTDSKTYLVEFLKKIQKE